ncbi:hypothetical protein GN156_31265, partial [bacterium LRH843]|nr:hypothetical protein [bacterium LRH843]
MTVGQWNLMTVVAGTAASGFVEGKDTVVGPIAVVGIGVSCTASVVADTVV